MYLGSFHKLRLHLGWVGGQKPCSLLHKKCKLGTYEVKKCKRNLWKFPHYLEDFGFFIMIPSDYFRTNKIMAYFKKLLRSMIKVVVQFSHPQNFWSRKFTLKMEISCFLKVLPVIFMIFWIRKSVNKLDFLTPQDL